MKDPLDLDAGEMLFRAPITFLRGATKLDDLPPPDRVEAAFAGRSNVGKSSLLNALSRRRDLARTSGDPGRTRELNFFDVGELLRLVDLPGYGYAKAPKTMVAQWTQLTRDFLRGRTPLKRVFLLIDARHGVKTSDEGVMDILDTSAVSYQVVLTKTDKISGAARLAVEADTATRIARRPAAFPRLVSTSSHSGDGIDRLRAEIAELFVR